MQSSVRMRGLVSDVWAEFQPSFSQDSYCSEPTYADVSRNVQTTYL